MRYSIQRLSIVLMTVLLSVSALSRDSWASQFAGTITSYGKAQCIALDHFSKNSGAQYSPKDSEKEVKLCGIDFGNKTIGLCPKIWSTSPGTIVYDISRSKYNGSPESFEAEYCPKQRALKGKVSGVDRLASYKQSINGQFNQRTSATFSQASPLYYHFSRYFNATVDVPVAVIRTMDAQEHLHRVTGRGLATAPHGMIFNGWSVVNSAERTPAGYSPVNEFYYGDPKNGLFYGTMLKGPGARYGPEFNGNISGKGYSEQYVFLEKTPAFLALSSSKDFADAASFGISESKKDPVVAKALGPNASSDQMMFWMTDLSEICLLDYIFSQQDRPGNIDYLWVWYYVDKQGQVKSERTHSEASRTTMASIHVPNDLEGTARVVLIQKTQLNDNDAGGRRYTNFTKKFGLLKKFHHLNPVTYRQLIHLAKDFAAKGPLYLYLRDTFYLNNAYTDMIAQNTIQAAQILQNTCNARALRFDLNPEAYLTTGKAKETAIYCSNP